MEIISFGQNRRGHYSPGTASGRTLRISGQLPIDPATGKVVDGGLGSQTRQALANLERVLLEAGAERKDVVICRVYTADIAGWDEIDAVYAEFFGPHRPARAVVPTGSLHYGALVEIEAEAEMPAARYVCSRCGRHAPTSTRAPKCECGGLWQIEWTPPAFSLDRIDRSCWNIFRYREFMPLTDDSWRGITRGEGMTPVIRFDDLMLKMDYMMPTLSFKDRGAAVLVSHCKAIGVDAVVQDSSGNAGNSVAAYCAAAGIECDIYVPEGTSPNKIDMIRAHGAAAHVVPGSRDHCAEVCRAEVDRGGRYYANHVYDPFFYEGTKTYIYELYEQLGRIPKNLFIPLGNGTLFIGAMLGLEHLIASGVIDTMPNVVAVQSEMCDPFAKAVLAGLDEPAAVTPRPTLAEGIAIGVPMRGAQILGYIKKYGLKVVTAPEGDILDARAELARRGIYCEHTTAANLAAYRKYVRDHGPTPDCVLPMTGAGLKSDH